MQQQQIKQQDDANKNFCSTPAASPPLPVVDNLIKNLGPYAVESYEEGLVWVVKSVLSQQECEYYINYAESICGFKESTAKNPYQAKFDSKGTQKR